VRQQEKSLIEDYLDGKLPGHDRKIFEAKYLTVPALSEQVESVSRARLSRARKSIWNIGFSPGRALAALGLVAVLIPIYFYRQGQVGPSMVAVTSEPETGNRISTTEQIVHLAPGIAKGANANSIEFKVNPSAQKVTLELAMPRQVPQDQFVCKLLRIEDDGHTTAVWTSSTLQSTSAQGGPTIRVAIPATVLKRADYLANIASQDARAEEKFFFRVY
jgi:hypothetical protein